MYTYKPVSLLDLLLVYVSLLIICCKWRQVFKNFKNSAFLTSERCLKETIIRRIQNYISFRN